MDFYGAIFEFELRGSHRNEDGLMEMAFLDMGDQFLALSRGRRQGPDDARHFGLVVDDRSAVRELATAAGAKFLDGKFVDFLDPWGNRIEIVEYADLQFSKTDAVLKAMSLSLGKTPKALDELAKKEMR
jgi:catechol 2,3-dioxygenase-like lactoylglutathione lyase family enzyme